MANDGGSADAGAGAGAGAGGAAGGGSAMDLLTGGAGAAGSDGGSDGGQGGDGGAGAGAGVGGDGGQGGSDLAWLEQLGADNGDGISPRDIAKAKGWKSMDDVVRSYHEVERAFRESGRVKVPTDKSTPEEVSAWRKAIGVPDTAEGYKLDPVTAPDGSEVQLDNGLLGRLAAKAHEIGVPEAAYKALVGDYVQAQLEEFSTMEAGQRADAADWVKDQGDKAAAKSAAVNRAAEALGLDGEEVLKVRNALGSKRALDMLAKLGEGIGEDVVMGLNGGQKFLMNADQAQAQIDQMKGDPATVARMTVKGTPEFAKYNRLLDIVGEAANRRAAAGL